MSTRDQVRDLLQQGKDTAEIAEALGKSEATIYYHVKNIQAESADPDETDTSCPVDECDEYSCSDEDDSVMVRGYLLKIDQLLDFIGEEPDKAVCDAALTICGHILIDGVKAEFETKDDE